MLSVQEALDALGSHRTVIIIAHRLSTIRNANQIIVMDDGLISEVGTHDELLRNQNSHYAKLWNMQIRGGASDSASPGSALSTDHVSSLC